MQQLFLYIGWLLQLAVPGPGEKGGPPLVLTCSKALTCAADPELPQRVDRAALLIEDGELAFVGPAAKLKRPDDAVERDLGDAWVMPGMIDLHSHVGGSFDWGSHEYLTNPGLRASTMVRPDQELLKRAVRGGVTSVLHIPGSATNMGGQGVLLKLGHDRYERSLLRHPGALKIAQAGNPEDWTIGVARSWMAWNLRDTIRRGLGYARRWQDFEAGAGARPDVDPQWEVFRGLLTKETPIAVHTQIYAVVLATVRMLRGDFDLNAFIDHGTFDGWRAAGSVQDSGMAAILGPRMISFSMKGWVQSAAPWYIDVDTDGRVDGVAARYQERGVELIGFNTDDIGFPVSVSTEDLSLQAAMAVRYGFKNDELQAVRGLTIVPALVAGLDHRVGSLEVGKDADVVVMRGDPADPRSRITEVYVEGKRVHRVRQQVEAE